jgi:hypothetical protein
MILDTDCIIYISMQPLSTIEDGEEKEKEKAIDEILALLPVIVNLENHVAKRCRSGGAGHVNASAVSAGIYAN